LCVFSLLPLSLHVVPSPLPFVVILPFSTPLWLIVLSTALLWIVVLPLQQHSLPLHYLCFHKMLFFNFFFLWFFNANWIYWCSTWFYLLSCTPTSSSSVQKLNYRCFSYFSFYHLRKLYLLIIHLPFCTFLIWWWMRWWPYSQ
jgi:hypothetical protein